MFAARMVAGEVVVLKRRVGEKKVDIGTRLRSPKLVFPMAGQSQYAGHWKLARESNALCSGVCKGGSHFLLRPDLKGGVLSSLFSKKGV